jgi:hypothetical protein
LDHFDNRDLPYNHVDASTKLQVLIPASGSNPNLCKTTLSLQLLGYPAPTFMGWGAKFEEKTQVDGGARLGTKIIYALHSLLKSPAHDDDLVLIADGYDVWMQLPPEVLIQRYNAMNRAANMRIAYKAGKRAIRGNKYCDSAPKPPSPQDWYSGATSASIKRTQYNSDPPRFLDSGYIMGRMIDMRTLLVRAQEVLDTTPNSEKVFDGSAQPIFNKIYSDQERQRNRWYHKILPSRLSRKYEFGIGLDHFSELSHSTYEAVHDAEYLTYHDDNDIELQSTMAQRLLPQLADHYLSDCALNLPSQLPLDIAASRPPIIRDNETAITEQSSWHNLPLLTNLCTGTVPVLIHHNGDKMAREEQWHNTWFAPHAKEMLQKIKGAAGGWTDSRKWIEWDELCPAEWDDVLFKKPVT